MGMIANLAPIRVSADRSKLADLLEFSRVAVADELRHYDVVILGGGCAGLSLAMRLAALGRQCPSTLVIERRHEYSNDRTWCFWGECSASVNHLVQHRWQRVSLQDGQRVLTVDCGAAPYQLITAEAFYKEALTVIGKSGRIDLRMGMTLESEPEKVGDEWRIVTQEGRFSATKVLDTRPLRQTGAVGLWQSFYGCEIESDSDVFEADCAQLMHFAPGGADRVNFNYVLPFSSRRALVEATVFGVDPLSREQLEGELQRALKRKTPGAGYKVLRVESGMLPMGGARPRAAVDASYVRAGLSGGAGRASTGYAFQRIQRWADDCADMLSGDGLPLEHPADPALLRALDYLFVSVLRSRPKAAPSLFMGLFEKTETARLIRFLSDEGTLADYIAVAAALPAGLFIQEIPRAVQRKLGRVLKG